MSLSSHLLFPFLFKVPVFISHMKNKKSNKKTESKLQFHIKKMKKMMFLSSYTSSKKYKFKIKYLHSGLIKTLEDPRIYKYFEIWKKKGFQRCQLFTFSYHVKKTLSCTCVSLESLSSSLFSSGTGGWI